MRRSVLVLLAGLTALAACSSDARTRPTDRPAPSPTTTSSLAPVRGSSTPAPSTPPPRSTTATRSTTTAPRPARSTSSTASAAPARLPLELRTGDAQQVITVVAPSGTSTTGVLQTWTRAGGGWSRAGPSVTAHLGAAGLGHASEGSTRTPAGSFTLTAAFGRDANPGTALPYTQTTPADWWISEPGPSYNTLQRCTFDCGFVQGEPNEHLYYETPYYELALVIDYNTANSPGGVRAGAGSAFFVHVTDGAPTAGCVSIPKDRLTSILRWLRPAAHPRILIGVAG